MAMDKQIPFRRLNAYPPGERPRLPCCHIDAFVSLTNCLGDPGIGEGPSPELGAFRLFRAQGAESTDQVVTIGVPRVGEG
jgi:hypothetical protein